MRAIFHIAWRDFRSLFTQPLAYVLITGNLLLTSMVFNSSLSRYLINQRNPQIAKTISLNANIVDPLFTTISVFLLVLAPLITMRLFAEEFRLRTDELWMTSPVSITQILLGKYAAAMLFFLILLASASCYPFLLTRYGDPEISRIWVDALGLYAIVGCLVAAGLFASSLTENLVVAFFGGFGINMGLWILVGFGDNSWFGRLLSYLSLSSHYVSLTQGLLDTRDILYVASYIFFFLFLTSRSLESKGWR